LTVGADLVQGANLAEYLFHQPLEQSLARKLTVMSSHMTFNDYVCYVRLCNGNFFYTHFIAL